MGKTSQFNKQGAGRIKSIAWRGENGILATRPRHAMLSDKHEQTATCDVRTVRESIKMMS